MDIEDNPIWSIYLVSYFCSSVAEKSTPFFESTYAYHNYGQAGCQLSHDSWPLNYSIFEFQMTFTGNKVKGVQG